MSLTSITVDSLRHRGLLAEIGLPHAGKPPSGGRPCRPEIRDTPRSVVRHVFHLGQCSSDCKMVTVSVPRLTFLDGAHHV